MSEVDSRSDDSGLEVSEVSEVKLKTPKVGTPVMRYYCVNRLLNPYCVAWPLRLAHLLPIYWTAYEDRESCELQCEKLRESPALSSALSIFICNYLLPIDVSSSVCYHRYRATNANTYSHLKVPNLEKLYPMIIQYWNNARDFETAVVDEQEEVAIQMIERKVLGLALNFAKLWPRLSNPMRRRLSCTILTDHTLFSRLEEKRQLIIFNNCFRHHIEHRSPATNSNAADMEMKTLERLSELRQWYFDCLRKHSNIFDEIFIEFLEQMDTIDISLKEVQEPGWSNLALNIASEFFLQVLSVYEITEDFQDHLYRIKDFHLLNGKLSLSLQIVSKMSCTLMKEAYNLKKLEIALTDKFGPTHIFKALNRTPEEKLTNQFKLLKLKN